MNELEELVEKIEHLIGHDDLSLHEQGDLNYALFRYNKLAGQPYFNKAYLSGVDRDRVPMLIEGEYLIRTDVENET